MFEEGAHGLILSEETDTNESVPLAKVDGRCWILRLDPNYARFYLGRWPEIVLSYLQTAEVKKKRVSITVLHYLLFPSLGDYYYYTTNENYGLKKRMDRDAEHYLEYMVNFSEELSVDRQSTIQFVTRLGNEPLGEFPLEHEEGAAEHGSVQKQFEYEWRRDLIGQIGYADVEEGQICFEHISNHYVQFGLQVSPLNSFLQFCNHPWINFTCNHLQ